MARNPRYNVLFEPVRIGPVTAPNRFYQVPHASGMTNALPHVRAAMRAVKAEGGWGVVCTGAVSVHPSSDDLPLPTATLWDEAGLRAHALMTEAVHRHGALAGVELWHGGGMVMNRTSRIPPISPSGMTWMPTHVPFMGNLRARVMTAADIAELRRWYRDAAIRARQAGFDIIYVYAGMGYLLHQFLLQEMNQRSDAYGGPVANRCRIIKELIETVRDATAGQCGVALRISLQDLRARAGEHAPSEAHEVVTELSAWPDLWDVKMDVSPSDCPASRFAPEGSHEPVIDFVKKLTDKPVVGVGRFTSPDAMVSQIRRGVLDLIGAARPSIADPFLPRKIDAGQEDEIRECIGCNICIASWHEGVPVRCTQNATMGEEWRRGWHPERVVPRGASQHVLVIGAGPAGLECAVTLGRRGYTVALADRADQAGGRVAQEAALPGLAAWRRVIEYRLAAITRLANVTLYLGSEMTAEEALEFGADIIVVAAGARWTTRRFNPRLEIPGAALTGPGIFTPDDVFAGRVTQGPVLLFDYDNFYLGGVIAEHLARQGLDVTYVTPAGHVSAWTINTNEQPRVYEALHRHGVKLQTRAALLDVADGQARVEDVFTGALTVYAAASVVIVGARAPRDELAQALQARQAAWADFGLRDVATIGDALAPGLIANAVHGGALFARGLDMPAETLPYRLDHGLHPHEGA